MLHTKTKEYLQNSKNLLAFSGGGDSSALFFILQENHIPFDIAIVDYGVRQQSKEEVAYALNLARKYGIRCYVKRAEPIEQNFEANARNIRYNFFEQLIEQHRYENLISAHHLGDRLEWFLMQLSKGAGCVELSGMQEMEQRENYTLVRPLLHLTKQHLLNYLDQHNYRYFEDATNKETTFKRNYFREKFSEPLLAEFGEGIARSFRYIDRDNAMLVQKTAVKKCNKLAYFASKNPRSDLVTLDRYLKGLLHVMRASEKEQFLQNKSVVIGRRYIATVCGAYVFVAPYIVASSMPKKLKERLRMLKINPKLRGYLAGDAEAVELLSLLLA
ncbi:MAG: tRNA lysidine(34) synthetase TilS [Epsilonproteobacteria bacterium]|nr:tRNA lysidine(34) synthetase TilS [Campylobacterota bacterium]